MSVSYHYYTLLALGCGAFISSAYYLYSIVQNTKEEEMEKDNNQGPGESKLSKKMRKCKQKYIELKAKCNLSNEEILALISRDVEMQVEIDDSELLPKRISLIEQHEEEIYRDLVFKSYLDKSKMFEEAKAKYEIIYKDNFKDQVDFQMVIQSSNYNKSEKILFNIYAPNFSLTDYPNRETTKKAILFHCKEVLNMYYNMQKESQNNKSSSLERKKDIIIARSRIDDGLYLNFGLTMSKLMFLVYFYSLDKDYEVKSALMSVGKV